MSVSKAGSRWGAALLLLGCTAVFLSRRGDKHEEEPFLSGQTYEVCGQGQQSTWPKYKSMTKYDFFPSANIHAASLLKVACKQTE